MKVRIAVVGWLMLTWCGLSFTQTQIQTPAPAVSPGQAPAALAAARPELREFFIKAMAADAMTDPLQRCLAFPDLPGNHWPKGMTDWYCARYFGPAIAPARIAELINRSAWVELNALFRADLERHFLPVNPSEAIHRDVEVFAGIDKDQDRLSKLWVDNDPASPFANAVRAGYLAEAGFDARGTAYLRDTPAENVRQMEAFTSQALKFYEKALKLEPKLTPAHVGLIRLHGLGASDETVESAYERGMHIAPHCRDLTTAKMRTLRPKWGGSFEEMDAYAQLLGPLAEIFPQHRLTMVMPDLERAQTLQVDDKHAESIALLEPLALETPSLLVSETLAMAERPQGPAGNAEKLMYFLSAYRFAEEGGVWPSGAVSRVRGATMTQLEMPAWALPSLRSADRRKPHDPHTGYWLGYTYYKLGRDVDAEAPLIDGLAAKDTRPWSLYYLIGITSHFNRHADTVKYATIVTIEEPSDSSAWYAMANAQYGLGAIDKSIHAAERFLATVDRKNPDNKDFIQEMEALLARARPQAAGQPAMKVPSKTK
jgi:tetratricopeptide (TPR) repeat protein